MIAMMHKKAAKLVEPHTERWENIALYPIRSYKERTRLMWKWMDIIHVAKDDLLIKTFGQPTFRVDYSVRNKVWAFAFEKYVVLLYRSVEGTSMQVSPTMSKRAILSFIDLLYKEWNKEIKAWQEIKKGYKKRMIK